MVNDRRRFTSAERVALYLAAAGRCTSCGVELLPGWHADHISPYSRGGATDVINGQALCPPCNLKKGATTMNDLRPWQQEALRRFLGSDNDFLAVVTPGAGKTRFAIEASSQLLDTGVIDRVIVVVPTAPLRSQWKSAAAALDVQLDDRFINSVGALARDMHGVIVTYQSIAASPLLWRKLACDTRHKTLVILDEIHHAGDQASWGAAIRIAFSDAQRRLLLSGTPFRTDGAPLPFVTYVNGWCRQDYAYDYQQALQGSVVRPVEFLVLDGEMQWREPAGAVVSIDLTDTDDQTRSNAFTAAYDPEGNWISSVLRRADADLTRHRLDVPDAGGLIVASNMRAARSYGEIMERISGEPSVVVVSEDADSAAKIKAFTVSTCRWLVAVQMVSEGVDIPRLSVGVYASRYLTEMFFRQVVGRFVRLRGSADETCAALFIPAVEPLVRMAGEIADVVQGGLRERAQRAEREAKEYGGPQVLDLVTPLGSTESRHVETILGGDTFTQAELVRAEAAKVSAGVPESWPTSQIARLLRASGVAPSIVGHISIDAPVRAVVDEKAELRLLIKTLVGRWNRRSGIDYMEIHLELNGTCGDKVATATLDSLKLRVTLLEQWISDTA